MLGCKRKLRGISGELNLKDYFSRGSFVFARLFFSIKKIIIIISVIIGSDKIL